MNSSISFHFTTLLPDYWHLILKTVLWENQGISVSLETEAQINHWTKDIKYPNLSGRTDVPILNPQFSSTLLVLGKCCRSEASAVTPWIPQGVRVSLYMYNWAVQMYEFLSDFFTFLSLHHTLWSGSVPRTFLKWLHRTSPRTTLLLNAMGTSQALPLLSLMVWNTSYLKHTLSLPAIMPLFFLLLWLLLFSFCVHSLLFTYWLFLRVLCQMLFWTLYTLYYFSHSGCSYLL